VGVCTHVSPAIGPPSGESLSAALPTSERDPAALVDTCVVPGPGQSFDELYRREYRGLVAVAAAITGDLDVAPDLVHDAMVKAFIRWDRVSQLDRPGAWCHHVLVNACRSHLRRRSTERRFFSRQRRVEASVPGPSAEVVAFWEVVRTLPERHRSVVALHFAGDLTSVQIAEVLSIPEGTARSDLAFARRVVMAALQEGPHA
jgi:RNA polymerase sigma factor (sigma-70 family)